MDVVALNWSLVPFAEALPSPWRTKYMSVIAERRAAASVITSMAAEQPATNIER